MLSNQSLSFIPDLTCSTLAALKCRVLKTFFFFTFRVTECTTMKVNIFWQPRVLMRKISSFVQFEKEPVEMTAMLALSYSASHGCVSTKMFSIFPQNQDHCRHDLTAIKRVKFHLFIITNNKETLLCLTFSFVAAYGTGQLERKYIDK